MRFATLPDGTPDGRLHLVSRDNTRAVPSATVGTLQAALDDWETLASALELEYARFDADDRADAIFFNPATALAPLPRAWQWLDASAYPSHGELMSRVFGFAAVHELGAPLMYQGIADRFQASTEDAPFPDVDDQIDFEGEFGIVTGHVPLGCPLEKAAELIRLVVQINDWSLRRLGRIEMKTGFGMIQSKPRSSMAPVALTPDELGDDWRNCQVAARLDVLYNGDQFGAAQGEAMSIGFDGLVAHAAYSRDLVAGTVIGSGTVSNANFRDVGSSCITERRAVELADTGIASTPFMAFGDVVSMEARARDGRPLFGPIRQRVVSATAA